jgi:uncharacterized protein
MNPDSGGRADEVLVFTKFPLAGFAKTRLIPALGADRAAAVSRVLSDRCIRTVREYASSSSTPATSVAIHYASRTEDASAEHRRVQEWLGVLSNEMLVAQVAGNLGDRLVAAFQSAFDRGARKVVVVGTDIPDIDTCVLRTAFTALDTSDAVVGPALDGGYYLLGLSGAYLEVFRDVQWGTDAVFAETKRNMKRLGLAMATLRVLRDIDLPADIAHFEFVCDCKA